MGPEGRTTLPVLTCLPRWRTIAHPRPCPARNPGRGQPGSSPRAPRAGGSTRDEQGQPLPEGEAFLGSSSSLRRRLKKLVFRTTRPATRRYDRLSADLATIASDLASRLAEAEEVMRKARGDYERLELAFRALAPTGAATSASGAWTEIPGRLLLGVRAAHAWRHRIDRRSPARLRGARRSAPGDRRRGRCRRPRWIDLGCGQGEFCTLLREWGWDVEGIDASPDAIAASRTRGIDATLADVLAYLETRPDDPVGGVSAIQLIEHLPRRAWVHLFEEIHRALSPGGALLLETINGQSPDAIADYFVADVTHTWPGHPETLRLMAEHAGFEVEVRFLHEDHRGRAQDVAIWAVKAALVSGSESRGPEPTTATPMRRRPRTGRSRGWRGTSTGPGTRRGRCLTSSRSEDARRFREPTPEGAATVHPVRRDGARLVDRLEAGDEAGRLAAHAVLDDALRPPARGSRRADGGARDAAPGLRGRGRPPP